MKRLLKILAVAVVLVLVGTYVIYVLDYKGNYNVSTTVTLNVDSTGGISLTEFDYAVEPTSIVQFWDLFKQGAGGFGDTSYKIYFELNQSGQTWNEQVCRDLSNGDSKILTSEFENLSFGDAVLKITVRDRANTYLFEKSYSVVVG